MGTWADQKNSLVHAWHKQRPQHRSEGIFASVLFSKFQFLGSIKRSSVWVDSDATGFCGSFGGVSNDGQKQLQTFLGMHVA